jgi:hypothetical protein
MTRLMLLAGGWTNVTGSFGMVAVEKVFGTGIFEVLNHN